jgi:alpha-L-fucosidase
MSLGKARLGGATIERVDLLGGPELTFRQDNDALRITLPQVGPSDFVPVLRLRGRGLV